MSEVFPLDEPLTSGGYNVATFADIDLDSSVPAEALTPSISLDNFTWYTEPQTVLAKSLVDRTDFLCRLATGRRVIHVGFVDAGYQEMNTAAGTWLHAHLAAASGGKARRS